ncbi:multidrug ABC transporter permease [Spirochaetia bacterium]|nr:multidrug ABC transporter permease [Spirochaetia bacterium]
MSNTTPAGTKLPFFKILFRVTPLVFRTAPFFIIISNLIGALHGMSWAFAVFANQRLYDALSAALFSGGPVSAAFFAGALVAAVSIGTQLLNGIHNFIWRPIFEKATGRLSEMVHRKAALLPALDFENKERLDDINKAAEGMRNSVAFFLSFYNLFTFYLPYFLFLFVYLYRIKPLLTVSFVIIFIPVFLSQIVRAKLYAKLEKESAPLRRESEHYEQCLCGQEFMKETRLLGAYRYFKTRYMETIETLSKKQWGIEKRINVINLGLNILTLAGYGGILFMLFRLLMGGEISVGAFAAVYSSVGMMFNIMNEIFTNHLSSITRGLGSVNNFIRFLDLGARTGEHKRPDFSLSPEAGGGIIVKDVSFSYPLAEKPSVEHVSLEIRPGETVAIVGENGSGKSTLVKLLAGLYTPSGGSVTIGGADTATTAPESLFAEVSAVFQTYQRYKLTLEENIRISDTVSTESIDTPARQTNIDLRDSKTFPQGEATVLSREFDGTDLSGGQWQRVAIARGLYRNHQFILLDEPTAAIDPIEETRVYRQFAEISQGKTAVIVTHRLGSARIAKRIIVMDSGRIVETGAHEELVEQGGVYAEMWKAQAKFYVE